MTIEEALKNTFICNNLPGGWARLPYETCLKRQDKKMMGRPGGDTYYKFIHCLDCKQGQENIKIWKEKSIMARTGTCEGCGRENMALPTTILGHFVCGFCRSHINKALDNSLSFDEASAEIKSKVHLISKTAPLKLSWEQYHETEQPQTNDPARSQPEEEESLPTTAPSAIDCCSDDPTTSAFSVTIYFNDDERDNSILQWLLSVSQKHRRTEENQIMIMLENHMNVDKEVSA